MSAKFKKRGASSGGSTVAVLDRGYLAVEGWAEAARILAEVGEAETWRSSHATFTEWIKSVAKQSGVPESSLWRMLRAGQFYNRLGKQYGHVAVPPIGEVCTQVTPEQLELVEKISRLAPQSEVEKLLAGVLDGSVSRNRLREVWKVYQNEERKTLPVDTLGKLGSHVREAQAMRRRISVTAGVWLSLQEADPSWTGISHPHFYRAFYDPPVRFDGEGDSPNVAYEPDFLAILQGSPHGEIVFHAFEMVSPNLASSTIVATRCALALRYVDCFWVLLYAGADDDVLGALPKAAGVMSIDGKKLKVHRFPRRSADYGALAGQLAKSLLTKIL